MDADDPQLSYVLLAYGRVAGLLREDFLPFLAPVMPDVLRSAGLQIDVAVLDGRITDGRGHCRAVADALSLSLSRWVTAAADDDDGEEYERSGDWHVLPVDDKVREGACPPSVFLNNEQRPLTRSLVPFSL
jgi:hypothetical protein